jgi:hypothetical protein
MTVIQAIEFFETMIHMFKIMKSSGDDYRMHDQLESAFIILRDKIKSLEAENGLLKLNKIKGGPSHD